MSNLIEEDSDRIASKQRSSTGRKVSDLGLGAFRGLRGFDQINKATEKYKNKAEPAVNKIEAKTENKTEPTKTEPKTEAKSKTEFEAKPVVKAESKSVDSKIDFREDYKEDFIIDSKLKHPQPSTAKSSDRVLENKPADADSGDPLNEQILGKRLDDKLKLLDAKAEASPIILPDPVVLTALAPAPPDAKKEVVEKSKLQTSTFNASEPSPLQVNADAACDIPGENSKPYEAITNPSLNRHKSVINPSSNRNQSVINPSLITHQSVINDELMTHQLHINYKQMTHQSVINDELITHQSVINDKSIHHQSVTKSSSIRHRSEQSFSTLERLSNLEHSVLLMLYRGTNGTERTIQQASRATIAQAIGSKPGSVGNVLMKLTRLGLIKPTYIKNGPGGWSSYEISETIYSRLGRETFRENFKDNLNDTRPRSHSLERDLDTSIRHQSVINPSLIRHQSITESVTYPSFSPSSKEVSKNFNSDSLTETQLQQNWFAQLDFTSLPFIRSFTIINAGIRNLALKNLTLEQVQDFIHRFTNWLTKHQKETKIPINSPVAMFCEKLKDFANDLDSPILYAQTEEERAAELLYLNEIKRRQKEDEENQLAIEKAAEDSFRQQFEKWYAKQSDQDLARLQIPSAGFGPGSDIYKNLVKEYVKANNLDLT